MLRKRARLLTAAAAVTALIGLSAGTSNAAGPSSSPVTTTHAIVDESTGIFLEHAKAAALKALATYYYWPASSVNGGPNGYCVDDPNDGGDGTQLQIWSCHAVNQEYWLVHTTSYGSSYYELVLFNGKCLDDANDSTSNGAKVQGWDCLGNANQAWYYNKYSGSNGNYAMWINSNGVCLDRTGAAGDGYKLQMWQCVFPPHNDNVEAWQVPAATW